MSLPDIAAVERRITDREAAELYGCCRSHFWALVAAGRAPQPIVRRARYTRWRLGDVLAELKSANTPPNVQAPHRGS